MLHQTLQKVFIASEKAYKEMIKSNLSLLVNIETGFDFDRLDANPDASGRYHPDTIFGAPLTQEGICQVNQLIDHILKREHIIKEGLFRVSGSKTRQEDLQSALTRGTTIDINFHKYTIHDVCCLLKKYLRDLPQPLLLDSLVNLWSQLADEHLFADGRRRLDAAQLLLLLLPAQNREFFKDLSRMFTCIVTHADRNRMTASNLATVFSPMLFLPKDIDGAELARRSTRLTQVLEFLIVQGGQIFEPPEKLLADARVYLENLKQQMTHPRAMMSTTALIPTTKFCTQAETPKDYTQRMLAELMADIQTMQPQSEVGSKKSSHKNRLIKKLQKTPNKLDMPLTKLKRDKEQQALIKESLKKSKASGSGGSGLAALGSAIKKRLKMTPSIQEVGSRKRKSLSSSVLPPPTLASTSANNTASRTPRTPRGSIVPIEEDLLPLPTTTNTTPRQSRRRSSSSSAVVFVTTPIVATATTEEPVEQEDKQIVVDLPPPSSRQCKVSKSLLPPPPLPPKPSPRMIMKRRASVYSLPPATTSKLLLNCGQTSSPSRRSVSTKSLPVVPQTESLVRLRARINQPDYPSPLAELSNQKKVKTLLEKYESLSKASGRSKIPRLVRKPSIPGSPDGGDENYVCMERIPRKAATSSAAKLSRQSSSSNRSVGGKSPARSLLPLPEDYHLCADSTANYHQVVPKKTKLRRPLDLEQLQPRTPL